MNKKVYAAPAAEAIFMNMADGVMLSVSDTTHADPTQPVEVKTSGAANLDKTTVNWENWE